MKRIVLPFAAGAAAATLAGGLFALAGPAPAAEISPQQTPTATPTGFPTCVSMPPWPAPTALPSGLPPMPTSWPVLPVPTCAARTVPPSPAMP